MVFDILSLQFLPILFENEQKLNELGNEYFPKLFVLDQKILAVHWPALERLKYRITWSHCIGNHTFVGGI